ncbi:DUF6522 family protein [Rubellimicrobium roseum]|uniref:Uncharacterized protein n=1 Tax=Rubellimicrobium roseum TaxID=687525 RepID=A0A5C4NLJ1_9RHOB|nr:DUF6522 family protein [Rubellimicrobium roseum]TNC73279.1 hypothetical protein FHG71_05370 [Rubellimicrobium roseum]
MRLEPRPEGGFTIDATDLGPLLGIDPPLVPGLLRDGRIQSRFERGEGEDEGRFRLTFLYRGVRLRLILDGEGTVLSRSRVMAASAR